MEQEERPIPRREPELIQAEADRLYGGDTDKVATTSLESITVDGVLINSRYQKAEEFETMRDMILLLGPLRTSIVEIFCDSKATHNYTVTVRCWWKAEVIGRQLASAAANIRGGHNGIDVRHEHAPGLCVFIAPDWTGVR